MSVGRTSAGSTPRSIGSRLPAWLLRPVGPRRMWPPRSVSANKCWGVGCASSLRIDVSHLGVLATPRVDAETLAAGRRRLQLAAEAKHHRKLVPRLDTLTAQA